jgi:hypothetical protein
MTRKSHMTERNEISIREVEVYRVLAGARHCPERWLTNAEISSRVPAAALSTVRALTRKFVRLGLVDRANVSPGHRFRWSANAETRNTAYCLRLEQAHTILSSAS